MKCNQSRPGFELESLCPFPIAITITPRAPPEIGTLARERTWTEQNRTAVGKDLPVRRHKNLVGYETHTQRERERKMCWENTDRKDFFSVSVLSSRLALLVYVQGWTFPTSGFSATQFFIQYFVDQPLALISSKIRLGILSTSFLSWTEGIFHMRLRLLFWVQKLLSTVDLLHKLLQQSIPTNFL